jgi:hypothetical protein
MAIIHTAQAFLAADSIVPTVFRLRRMSAEHISFHSPDVVFIRLSPFVENEEKNGISMG